MDLLSESLQAIDPQEGVGTQPPEMEQPAEEPPQDDGPAAEEPQSSDDSEEPQSSDDEPEEMQSNATEEPVEVADEPPVEMDEPDVESGSVTPTDEGSDDQQQDGPVAASAEAEQPPAEMETSPDDSQTPEEMGEPPAEMETQNLDMPDYGTKEEITPDDSGGEPPEDLTPGDQKEGSDSESKQKESGNTFNINVSHSAGSDYAKQIAEELAPQMEEMREVYRQMTHDAMHENTVAALYLGGDQ